ncbi:MAG TPA: hypothetical protein VGQ62_16575 [Chloroflexota bacterium]|jgi:hypothetical protein|nr:hypothetical protein [Chloroflexota bacterium]
MPAIEHSTNHRAAELNGFFIGATRELATSVRLIGLYTELLDAQLAEDPSLSGLRAIVQDVRAQTGVVSALIDIVLQPA